MFLIMNSSLVVDLQLINNLIFSLYSLEVLRHREILANIQVLSAQG